MRDKWPNIRILGLEPSVVGYKWALGRWPANADLFPFAVWKEDTKLQFFRPLDLNHGTFFHGDSRHGEIEVEARSLDSLDRQYGPFTNAVLWMDIEGAEEVALEGAKGLLERGAIRAINLEVRPQTTEVLSGILKSYGFELIWWYFECTTYRDEVWQIP